MKSFVHNCSHCGEGDTIQRAEAAQCPTCHARPGKPCLDMRGKNPGVTPILKIHPARYDVIRDMDQGRPFGTLHMLPTASTG